MPDDPKRISWLDHINVYLLATPAGPVLVDSAAPGMLRWLLRGLARHGLQPEQLAGVVLTHFHIDHSGTALALARRGVPIFALGEDAAILRGETPHPGYAPLVGPLLRLAERLALGRRVFSEVRELAPGERIFGTDWRVVPAPGHTPGSLALHRESSGDLLSADTLVSDFGWPRGPHPLFTAEPGRARQSALALLALEPSRIHPGHGKPLPRSAYAGVRSRLAARQRHSGPPPARERRGPTR